MSARLFLRDFPFVLAGNVMASLAQWLLLLYLAHRGGTLAMGSYVHALALLSPLYILAGLGLRNLVAMGAGTGAQMPVLLQLRSGLTLLALILAAGIAWLAGDSGMEYFGFVAVLKALELGSDLYYGYLHQQGRGWLQGVSLLNRFLGGALLFAAGAALWGIRGGFGALMFTWSLNLLLFDRRQVMAVTVPTPETAPDPGRLSRLLRAGLPLALASALGSVVFNLPRYAVEYLEGVEALGVFAAVSSFVMFINLLCIALGQTLLPRLAALFAARNLSGFLKLLGVAGLVVLGADGLLLLLIGTRGDWLLTLTFGPALAAYRHECLLVSLLASPLYLGQLLSFGNMAVQRFRHTLWLTLLAGTLSLLLAGPVLEVYGLIGGGMMMAVVGLVQVTGFLSGILQQFRHGDTASARAAGPAGKPLEQGI
ncbi:MAG: hypothetical protein KDI44_07250 [Thiothrix sp.]|nr:hypothetical protein [Thiothrix sp.]HPQ95331.1 hypothetical protein [Thiolinea sp.]